MTSHKKFSLHKIMSSWGPGPAQWVKNQSGFTLIEVLIVVVVLSVAILGMEAVQLYAISQVQRGDNLGTAAAIAQDVMETLRNDPAALADGYLMDNSGNPRPVRDEAFSQPGSTYNTLSDTEREDNMRGRGGTDYYVCWKVRVLPQGDAVDVIVRWYTREFEDTGFNPYDFDESFRDLPVGVRQYTSTSIIF